MCKESNIPEGCKPFNLQDALQGKSIITRDGRSVKIAGYNPEANHYYSLVGWVNGETQSWSMDGKYYRGGESDDDLFMASETKDVWVVLFQSKAKDILSHAYETEEYAYDALRHHSHYFEKTFGIHKITINI